MHDTIDRSRGQFSGRFSPNDLHGVDFVERREGEPDPYLLRLWCEYDSDEEPVRVTVGQSGWIVLNMTIDANVPPRVLGALVRSLQVAIHHGELARRR